MSKWTAAPHEGETQHFSVSWNNPLGPNQDKSNYIVVHDPDGDDSIAEVNFELTSPPNKTRHDVAICTVLPSVAGVVAVSGVVHEANDRRKREQAQRERLEDARRRREQERQPKKEAREDGQSERRRKREERRNKRLSARGA